MEEFFKRDCIRGYHVYKEEWEAAVGEALVCEKEPEMLLCGSVFVTGRYYRMYSDQ